MDDGNDRRAIAGAVQAFGDALNRQDFAAALALVTDDAVFWPDAAPETRGKDSMAAAYERLAGFVMHASFDIEEILQSGDVALVRGIEHFRLEPRAGGEAIVLDGRRAFSVWQRQSDGSWKNTRGMTNWAAPRPAPPAR